MTRTGSGPTATATWPCDKSWNFISKGTRMCWTLILRGSWIAHVNTLLKTQLLELAVPELLEQGHGLRLVGEQVETRLLIPTDTDGTVVNPIVNPVRRDLQGPGELRDRQGTGDAARMGLPALAQEAMPQPNEPDRAGQDGLMPGRAMPLLGQQCRDLHVRLAFLGQFDDLFFHLPAARQAGQGAHRDRQDGRRGGAPSPDNTDLKHVWCHALDHDLVDQTAQKGLLLLARQE